MTNYYQHINRPNSNESSNGTNKTEANMQDFNKFAKLLSKIPLIAVILIVVTILTSQLFVVTYPGEYNVIKQFGRIVKVVENDGTTSSVTVKIPFIQSNTRISSKVFLSDLAPSDVMTSDKKSMISDCFVTWKITDASLFIKNLSASTTNAESRISSNVYNVLKTVISSQTQEEIISGRDGEVVSEIMRRLDGTLDSYGIEILAVETKMLDLPAENKEAVYTRMISERNNIAASYKAQGNKEAQEIMNNTSEQETIIIANANKEAEKIIAEGEAEYMKILSDAYNNEDKAEFYKFVRKLDALEKTLQNGDNKLVLDKDSPLVDIFY